MPARIVERRHGDVLISTDPGRGDIVAAHAFLTAEPERWMHHRGSV